MSVGEFGQATFGESAFGTTNANPINLRTKLKTTTEATLVWDKQADAEGFRLLKNGSPISSSWQRDKTEWRISYNKGDTFEVVVIKVARTATITL